MSTKIWPRIFLLAILAGGSVSCENRINLRIEKDKQYIVKYLIDAIRNNGVKVTENEDKVFFDCQEKDKQTIADIRADVFLMLSNKSINPEEFPNLFATCNGKNLQEIKQTVSDLKNKINEIYMKKNDILSEIREKSSIVEGSDEKNLENRLDRLLQEVGFDGAMEYLNRVEAEVDKLTEVNFDILVNTFEKALPEDSMLRELLKGNPNYKYY